MKRLIITRLIQSIYDNYNYYNDTLVYLCTDTHNIYFRDNLIFWDDDFSSVEINDAYIVISVYGINGIEEETIRDYSDRTITDVVNTISELRSRAFRLVGSILSSEITSDLLILSNIGNVYNIRDPFEVGDNPGQISSTLFVDSVNGSRYPAGTNIVVINTGTPEDPVYKFDVLSNSVIIDINSIVNIKPDWNAEPGSPSEILNKPTIPSHTSDLTNDSRFMTEDGNASTTTPIMDGLANIGSEYKYARADHIHPSDTTKANKSETVSTIDYDTTNKKITKTIDSLTTDVISVSTLKTDLLLDNVTNDAQVKRTEMGVADGVATLDSGGKIPSIQLPSDYADDVIEVYARPGQAELSYTWFATESINGNIVTPESGIIYILMNSSTNYDSNTMFIWGTTSYIKINSDSEEIESITIQDIDTLCIP